MKFENLRCINDNVNLDDYLKLDAYVRENMQNQEWLGTFSEDEVKETLWNKGIYNISILSIQHRKHKRGKMNYGK